MNDATAALEALIARETERPLPFAFDAFVEAVHAQFGDAVMAVLFYGSCRRVDQPDGLYDLYVIVDRYRTLPRYEAAVAWLLPPNVYHLDVKVGSSRRQSKCTLISITDFRRGNSRQWFHAYLWGRFCQPVTIAWARDATARAAVIACLATAVRTFLTRSVCLLSGRTDIETLWTEGLRASYSTELRSEGPDRAREIYRHNVPYFEAVTRAAAHEVPGLLIRTDGLIEALDENRAEERAWRVRRVTGKLLSVVRILKAWTTFRGGLDYLVWKLERHSGQSIEVPERVRRRPLIHVWGFLWRLYRQGAFR